MAETSIEWTEQTWNPIVGCSVISPGCTNCYAMKMAARLERMGQDRYRGLTRPSKAGAVWTGEMRLVEEALTLPLRRRKPTTWFVNSMSDLFHESVPDEWIDRVFAVMALCPQHIFQVLTKRSGRMRDYCARKDERGRHPSMTDAALLAATGRWNTPALDLRSWPLPNVWLGVSAEDQRRADERVPDLLATLAAVRFVSAEPLLGPIDFTLINPRESGINMTATTDALAGLTWEAPNDDPSDRDWLDGADPVARLSWIIVGGESGPGARPMHPDWARQIRDACAAAGVAFHYKQAGSWVALKADGGQWPEDTPIAIRFRSDGSRGPDGWPMQLVGKKAAGRLLDGVEHNGMPAVRS